MGAGRDRLGHTKGGEPQAMRYSELSRHSWQGSAKRCSPKPCARRRDGLITRTCHLTVPVTVTYELTNLALVRSISSRGDVK